MTRWVCLPHVQAAAEPLREANRAALRAAYAACQGTLSLGAEDFAHEEATSRRESRWVARQEEAELEWNAEHPLSNGHVRKHTVDQVGGGPAHATRIA
jgi:hypothetical protein